MRRITPLLGLLIASALIVLPVTIQTDVERNGQAGPEEYILEAENATGEWEIGSMEQSVYWKHRFAKGSHAYGSYVPSGTHSGAKSSLTFVPPTAGSYLIGVQMHADERESGGGISVYLQNEEGKIIMNQLEPQAKGQANPRGGVWDLMILGLWSLPRERLTLTYESDSSRFIFLDYFFLAPVFEDDVGTVSVFLPISPWPSEGDWTWGNIMDWATIATDTPGAESSIPLHIPSTGKYSLYASTWHDASCDHIIDFKIGLNNSAEMAELVLENGVYWAVRKVGSFELPQGSLRISFRNNPDNPKDVPVAISALFIVPENRTSTGQIYPVHEEGGLRVDGLMEDGWEEDSLAVADPEGDQSLLTDIKELRVKVHEQDLYLLVDFYKLREHSDFLVEIDLDGNHEAEYWFEGGTKGRWLIAGWMDGSWQGPGSAAFEVMEMTIPLGLINPSSWRNWPETLRPDFDFAGAKGFYLRYTLYDSQEPGVLDQTNWAYMELFDDGLPAFQGPRPPNPVP